MGHTHGTKWTDDLVIDKINEVVDFLKLDRMPSRSEIEQYYGNHALINKISKTGGFYKYAKLLGLEIKNSESKLGIEYELKIISILQSMGFSAEHTSVKHPYDILVNGRVKIDVKVANISIVRGSKMYSFHLDKSMHSCDLYVAVALNDNKSISKIYIIPASVLNGKKQLAIGFEKSKYDQYLLRWDFVEKIDKSLSELEV